MGYEVKMFLEEIFSNNTYLLQRVLASSINTFRSSNKSPIEMQSIIILVLK